MIQVSNSEDELEKSSGVRAPRFIVARVANSSKEEEEEEEEEEMLLDRKRGLHELLMNRAKGGVYTSSSRTGPKGWCPRMLQGLSFLLLFLLLLLQSTPLRLPT